jgi:hypothetical protein
VETDPMVQCLLLTIADPEDHISEKMWFVPLKFFRLFPFLDLNKASDHKVHIKIVPIYILYNIFIFIYMTLINNISKTQSYFWICAPFLDTVYYSSELGVPRILFFANLLAQKFLVLVPGKPWFFFNEVRALKFQII